MKRYVLAALMVTGLAVGPVLADDAHHKGGAMKGGAMMDGAMTDAEVRKVDTDAKKLTLKHGEIKNLDMPPMTMVFRVKDPAMLDMVKAGDKVKVAVEMVGGKMTVMKLEPVK
ncbi:MAG: copper-binding protein [Proteobacteria bacterium]|nr:copper-binding protein [Pseudomonadota bacterium]